MSLGLSPTEKVVKGYSPFTIATGAATTLDLITGNAIVKLPTRGVLLNAAIVPAAANTGPLRVDLGVYVNGSGHSLAGGWIRGFSNWGEGVYWEGQIPLAGTCALWAVAQNDTGGTLTYVVHWVTVV